MIVAARPGMCVQNPGSVSTGMTETRSRCLVVVARLAAHPVANSHTSTSALAPR